MADGTPIGIRIARRRQALGMRQEDLAARVGVSRAAVANWESGKHFPQRKLGAVEEVLGISLDEPEPGEPEMPTPEELERLRQHIREVLGNDASPFIHLMDEALAGRPPSGPRTGAARGRAGSGSARWSGREQSKRLS